MGGLNQVAQDEAPGVCEPRETQPIGIFPAIIACGVIVGAVYVGVYITFAKFWTGAM